MKKDSRIYIAGHESMLGAALHRTLLSNNYSNIITVPASELDLTNQAAVNTFFNKEQPEYRL